MSKSFYWVLIANSTTIWPGFRASSIYFYIHTILQLCDIHPPPPQQHFFYKHSKVKFLSIFLINMILGCQKVTNIDPDVFYQNFLQMTNPVVQHLPVQNIFLLVLIIKYFSGLTTKIIGFSGYFLYPKLFN